MSGGRSVLVGGGSGALGRAVVRAFLEAGERVTVPWVVEPEREALERDEAAALRSGQLRLVAADVSDAPGAAAAAAAAEPVEVLVNGVGGYAGGSPVHQTALEVWDRMYRINLRTAVAMTRAVIPGMLERERGVVLNVASRAALERPPGLAAYAASKEAILVLTETLQKEVADRGVRVNAVVPTTIDTPGNRAAMPKADFRLWTPPERIAAVLLFLASDAGATVRGGAVPV